MMSISNYLEMKAKVELNETPERREHDLAALKEWLSKQPHLTPRTEDKFLISFLRNTKYRLESAKQKIDSYYTFRNNCPFWYKKRVPLKENEYNLMKNGCYVPLLQPNPIDYGRIVYYPLKVITENNCTVSDFAKIMLMTNDRYFLTDDCATISGQHSIIDFEGTTMITASQCLAISKQIMTGVENIYPIRILGFHFINLNKAPPMFDMVLKICRGLCKTKLAERFYIHDTLESLYKTIPKSLLPTEYGGDAGSLESLMKKFMDETNFYDEKWFLEDENYKTDESKRIGGSKANDLFGTEGSFRKLDID